MNNQPTWEQVEAAIYGVISTAAGVATVWSFQNVNAPALDYVRLSLGAMLTEGYDYTLQEPNPAWANSTAYAVGDHVLNNGGKAYTCTTAGTSASTGGGPTGTGTGIVDGTCVWDYAANAEIAIQVGGVREVALEIEGFTTSLVDVNGVTARSLVDLIKTKLRLPGPRAALLAVGVVPFEPGDVQWIPDVVSAGFRGRAVCTVRCRMPARAVAEYCTYIARISGVATVSGAPGTITAPFAAP